MRLLSWNVNGLRAVEKKGFVGWLLSQAPDVLCLQETKATVEQLSDNLTQVPGYHAHFASPEKKGYSGVALYTQKEPDRIEFGLGIERFDVEGRSILADYGSFLLANVYFPNGRSSAERLKYKMEFYDAFLELVDAKRAEGKSIIFCGDLNTAHKDIDLARPQQNEFLSGFLPEERAWIDKLMSHGYVDIFRNFNDQPEQYSYWDFVTFARDRNVGWRIDYFFVDEGLAPRVKDAYILSDVMGSDHCPVGIDIELSNREQ